MSVKSNTQQNCFERPNLEQYFIQTGFHDLLPLAWELANDHGYGESEMIEAVCKVTDKYLKYPPKSNRTAWFKTVFKEKLHEAKGDILTFNARKR